MYQNYLLEVLINYIDNNIMNDGIKTLSNCLKYLSKLSQLWIGSINELY